MLSLPKTPSGLDSGGDREVSGLLHSPMRGCEEVRRSFWRGTSCIEGVGVWYGRKLGVASGEI